MHKRHLWLGHLTPLRIYRRWKRGCALSLSAKSNASKSKYILWSARRFYMTDDPIESGGFFALFTTRHYSQNKWIHWAREIGRRAVPKWQTSKQKQSDKSSVLRSPAPPQRLGGGAGRTKRVCVGAIAAPPSPFRAHFDSCISERRSLAFAIAFWHVLENNIIRLSPLFPNLCSSL